MSIGTDLVYIPEFIERFSKSSELLQSVFSENEIAQNQSVESKAGVFAAKEACMKALGKKCDWRDITIEKNMDGKPSITSSLISSQTQCDVSISHSGDYATAVVVLLQ